LSLPGEAPRIDRLIEVFAAKYMKDNPKNAKLLQIQSVDTYYVLAFGFIMLATDLHNARVLHKMTVENFLRNQRGINGDNDLPQDFLRSIYRSISERPLIGGRNGTCKIQGYLSLLQKSTFLKRNISPQKIWCSVHDGICYIFRTNNNGEVPLHRIQLNIPETSFKNVSNSADGIVGQLRSRNDQFNLKFDSAESMSEWECVFYVNICELYQLMDKMQERVRSYHFQLRQQANRAPAAD